MTWESLFYFRVDGRKIAFAQVHSKYGLALIAGGNNGEGEHCQIEALQIYKANGVPKTHPNVQEMEGIFSNYDSIRPGLTCSIIDGEKHSMRIEV